MKIVRESPGPSVSRAAAKKNATRDAFRENVTKGAAKGVTGIPAAIASESSNAGVPRAGEWEKVLEKLAVYTSIAYAWRLTAGLDIEQEPFEMTDEQAQAVAAPASRIIARSALNKKYGRRVIESNDYFDLTVNVAEYVWTTQREVNKIRKRLAEQAPAPMMPLGVMPNDNSKPVESAATANGSGPSGSDGSADGAGITTNVRDFNTTGQPLDFPGVVPPQRAVD